MKETRYQVVMHTISTVLSRSGDTLLVGSNAYNIIEGIKMHGDLDFVTTNNEMIMKMPHKTHTGVTGVIHTAKLCIDGIEVDISTLDGLGFEEDLRNRSCVTSAVAISFDNKYRIVSHVRTKRIVPELVDANVWIRCIVRAKGGKRLARFWQKKLSKGFV